MNIDLKGGLAILAICIMSSFATGLAVNRQAEARIAPLESTVQRLYLRLDKQKSENSSLHSRLLIQRDQLEALGVPPIKAVDAKDRDALQLGCRMLSPSRVAC